MQFVDKQAFYKHIMDNFHLPRGSIMIKKMEEVGSEDTAFLFLYGPPFQRPGTETPFKGKAGVYILYINWFHMDTKQIIKQIEDWYTQPVDEVIGEYRWNDMGTEILEVLALMPNPTTGPWWDW